MNPRDSPHIVRSRTSSGHLDESYLIEERLQKLLTHAENQNGPKNIFYNVQEVPRLRKSIMARAVQNVFTSTPMLTNKERNFHNDTSANISPINSASEEVEVKVEEIEKNKELLTEYKQPVTRISTIVISSDSEDEEQVQNELKMEGSNRRHAEEEKSINKKNKCTKTSENGGSKQNLPNNSRNSRLRPKASNTSEAKDEPLNKTQSKRINLRGREHTKKKLSRSKSPKSKKTDAQIAAFQQESVEKKKDNREEQVQNKLMVESNKTRHAEVVNSTSEKTECTKISENGENIENLSSNSRNSRLRPWGSNTSEAKDEPFNNTRSKHITSIGRELIKKKLSRSKSPKCNKTIADAQVAASRQETTTSNKDNDIKNKTIQNISVRLLRSRSRNTLETQTNRTSPNLRKTNDLNFKKNKTLNEGNDFNQKSISESLQRGNRSRKEATVEKISPVNKFINEENQSSGKRTSDDSNIPQIIPSKGIMEDKRITKILEVRLQRKISPRKLSFASKESSDNLVSEIDDKSSTPEEVPVSLSKIPVARTRSKSREKNDHSKFKYSVPNKKICSLETKDCSENVKIAEDSGYLAKSPPKRPPRKKRIQNENKIRSISKMVAKDPVSTDLAVVPLNRNRFDKSVDPLSFNLPQNEKSIEKKKDNQKMSTGEKKLIETGTSPIKIFDTTKENVKKLTKGKELTKCSNSFNDHEKNMFPTLNASKAEILEDLVLKIKMINKEVQTSAKNNTKTFNKSSQISKKALTYDESSNNSNKSSSTDYSSIIRNFEEERNVLFQSLPQEDFSINFSSSDDELFEETITNDEQNRPWRLDDKLQIFSRRSSCKLNFLRSAQEIELEKDPETFNQSINILGNKDTISTLHSQSGVQDCTKKNKVQVYSRTTLHNKDKISRSTGSQLSESDKMETSFVTNIPNKEGPSISGGKSRPNSLHVKTQTVDGGRNKSPDLLVLEPVSDQEQTFKEVNGENNRGINKRGTTNQKVNNQRNKLHLVEDADEEVLAVPLDSTNACLPSRNLRSTTKKTSETRNEERRITRSTTKLSKSSTNKRVLQDNMKRFDEPIIDVQQVDDVDDVPLERPTPHLNSRDSISIRITDMNEANNNSEIRSNIEKTNIEILTKQSSNAKLNHVRTSNIDCEGGSEIPLKDKFPQVQVSLLNGSQLTNLKSVDAAEDIGDNVQNQSNHFNQIQPQTSINEDEHSSYKPPPPKKAAKTSKSRRKKVVSERDEGVSSTTTDPEELEGVRRSRRDRKVPQRRCDGKLALYTERDYLYFNGLFKTPDTVVDKSIKPKNKKRDIAKNKKGSGGKKGKRGKKVVVEEDINSRENNQSNDEASSNSNLNNVELNINIQDEVNHTPKVPENNVIVSIPRKHSSTEDFEKSHSISQDVTPTKKSKTTHTLNSKSNINVYGTSNDVETNANYRASLEPNEDFVCPSMLPQGSSRTVDKDSGQSTMLRNTFDESSVRIAKPLTGRITKSLKKRKNMSTKISKVLSRSINMSKEQEILNEQESNRMASPTVLNVSQDVASRRSSIVHLKPSNGEYINLMSDVNLISMRYIDKVPKFKLVKDNLLVTEGLRNFKDGGTMGYLKLLPAAQKPLHIARKFSLFYFVLEGEGFVQVHNKTSSIGKQSTFIIPIGVEYSIANTSKLDELVLGFVKTPNNREES